MANTDPSKAPANGTVLVTENVEWELFRSLGNEDGAAAYDLTTEDMSRPAKVGTAANIENINGLIDIFSLIGNKVNSVDIAFFTDSDSANDTFDFELFAWKEGLYSPAERVFATTGNACIVGTMACLKHPTLGTVQANGLWVDTISGADYSQSGVIIEDSGNNQIAQMSFDLRGRRYLRFRIFNAGGGGTECAKVGAIITGY